MNNKYIYEELEKEDTLIHEMIHLWTYKDGYAPKQAHGKEFKKKCKEIRDIAKKRYNKDYSLGTRATDSSKFEVADKGEVNNAIKQASLRGGGIVSIYFEVEDEKNPHRFFFCAQKLLDYTLVDIKIEHKDKLKSVYISGDSYIPMCEKFGKFKTMNNYNGYWSTENFAGSTELLKVGDNVINKGASDIRKMLNECFINEDKKPYIKPEITVIEIPAKINLSKINMEDIVNGVIDNFNDIDTRKTDSKMIKNN